MEDREKSEEITEGRRKLKRERNRDCREKQREDAENHGGLQVCTPL